MTFESWFEKLISNHVWYGPASMSHRPETFKAICNKVYMDYLAGNCVKSIEECRRHVYNIVCKTPGDNKKIDWAAKALEKMDEEKKEEWVPVTPEKRTEYLNKVQEIIKGSTMMSAVPRETRTQQAAEAEGQWLPKKPAPYPMTTAQEAYVRQRHVEYIKRNYEPRTGAKLPEWISEDEFNIQYDEGLI